MKKFVALVLFFLLAGAAPSYAYRVVATCPSTAAAYAAGMSGADPVIDVNGNVCVSSNTDPAVQTNVTVSATGTTAALPFTIPAVAAKTAFICGFSYRSNANATVTGQLTVAGVITGTMSFLHNTKLNATTPDVGVTEEWFYPCIPASAVNTAITVTGPAPGTGGLSSGSAWGYYK